MTRTLLILVCGAGPAADVGKLVALAHDAHWEVGVTATPGALPFLDAAALPPSVSLRSDFKPTSGSARRSLPDPQALIIAPATYNTVNKLAAGIADNYALVSAAESIGRGVPTVVVPFVNSALAARTPFRRSVAALRDEGLYVLFGAHDRWEPHQPGTGSDRRSVFPWSTALEVASRQADVRQ
ncbi:hypothetical protein CS0771_64470 [Catellatospora sp. IY07-71]|uniref:flavoprotein n=1 Tax=Catellatospora sp. IY07-71 TaxID=2728827 RepID=UPI001BB37023|nr:flavoprotein [Catellatospora sp. IY07-71]BCJ76903.1 hypothetical protein CS0771_64470 [Catellatospora sp. IY07-71]